MSQSHMSQSPKIEKINEINSRKVLNVTKSHVTKSQIEIMNEIKRDCPSDFLTHSLHDSEFVELTLFYLLFFIYLTKQTVNYH